MSPKKRPSRVPTPQIGMPFVYMKGWDGHRDIVETIAHIAEGPDDRGYYWVRNSNHGEGWIRFDASTGRWEDVDDAENPVWKQQVNDPCAQSTLQSTSTNESASRKRRRRGR